MMARTLSSHAAKADLRDQRMGGLVLYSRRVLTVVAAGGGRAPHDRPTPSPPSRSLSSCSSRRDLGVGTLSGAVLLLADGSRAETVDSAVGVSGGASGGVATSVATSAATSAAAPTANVVPLKPKLFIARDFLFAYPRGWRVVEDTENTDSRSDRRRQNTVRGEVVSPDGVTVSVIQQQASKLKQSLTTITDLKQLGTAQEVSKLVLPPGTTVYSTTTRSIPVPPKDTGISGVGVIERDPVTIYRYSVRLSNGVRSEIAVGILLGRVLILGAGFQEGIEGEQQNGLVCKAIADSFKLLPKTS